MLMFKVLTLSIVISLACSPGEDSSSDDNSSSNDDSGSNDDDNSGPGTLEVDTGEVELAITAVSALDSFDQDTEATGTGTLSISDGSSLTSSYEPQKFQLTAPTFKPDSITSGSPEGLRIKITKSSLITMKKIKMADHELRFWRMRTV